MADIKAWSSTAANNDDAPPDGFPENMAPSNVNNAARETMAAVRRWYEDAEWRDFGDTCTYASATTFTISGDLTDRYVANRRIRAVGSTTGTIYGTITESAYSDPTTTVTVVWDSGSLSSETLAISLGFDMQKLPFVPRFRGAMVRVSGSKTISSAGVIDEWDVEAYDTNGFWSASSPGRFTIPAGISKVVLKANVNLFGNTGAVVRIRRNGLSGSVSSEEPAAGSTENIINLSSAVLEVDADDYFEVTHSGNSTTLSQPFSWFSIEVIE